VFEHFSKLTLAGHAFERTQVFSRPVGHHVREEMYGVGQSVGGCLEPHHTLGHG
jgi:hypothetical protein